MVRKAAFVVAIALLALTAACSSASSPAPAAAGVTAAAVAATTCPTANTTSFAKTRFVANAALAGDISSTDVNGVSSQLANLRNAATQGGAAFTDNTNVSV